jgi:hypothetical protein
MCSKTLHYITRHLNGYGTILERKNTMADPIHNAGYFAAVGTLLAVLIIGALAIAGFRIPALRFPGFTNKGTLTVKVIDAPVDLTHLNITIDKLEILDSEGNWTNLELIDGEPIYFDLLALQNITLTLSRTEIPTGNYTKIRMHALTANATYTDGTTSPPLNLVANGKIDIILKPHLVMQAGGSIAVTIDLEPETAQITISHSLNLKPTMKAMVNE